MEQVLDREVGEFQCQFSYHTGLTPAQRELNLVIGFRFKSEDDIHRAVLFVRFGADIHVLRVEMTGLGYLSC